MSERFAILNTEAPSKKSHGERGQDNSKGNIFKQKPKGGRTASKVTEDSSRGSHKNHANGRNGQSRNLFRSRQARANVVKESEFNIEKCNFPVLGGSNTERKDNSVEDLYKNKIKRTKEEINEEEKQLSQILPPGWINLTKGNANFQRIQPTPIETEYHLYYNPRGARLIMENRRKHREELNDILGDMSPYWNMDLEFENDTEDYDEAAYQNETYDEEDDDYVEEW